VARNNNDDDDNNVHISVLPYHHKLKLTFAELGLCKLSYYANAANAGRDRYFTISNIPQGFFY